jgi:hypothetical protein
MLPGAHSWEHIVSEQSGARLLSTQAVGWQHVAGTQSASVAHAPAAAPVTAFADSPPGLPVAAALPQPTAARVNANTSIRAISRSLLFQACNPSAALRRGRAISADPYGQLPGTGVQASS